MTNDQKTINATEPYLPSIDELAEMYSTIGQGADNAGGFDNTGYWSSSEDSSNGAWSVGFYNGATNYSYKVNPYRARVIRSF